jgi:hypothetical protein
MELAGWRIWGIGRKVWSYRRGEVCRIRLMIGLRKADEFDTGNRIVRPHGGRWL